MNWAPTRGQQLSALCNWNSCFSLAELGVLTGRTTRALLINCPQLHVFAIDHWENGNPALEPGSGIKRRSEEDDGYRAYADVDMEKAHGLVLKLAEEFPGRLDVIRALTIEAAEIFPDGLLDGVFIDADHRTPAVRADIIAWTPKLAPHGWLYGHDYDFASVRAALDELLPGYLHYPAGIWGIAREKINTESWGGIRRMVPQDGNGLAG